MAKRRNVSGHVLRNAVPQPRDVAEFVAPRTVNEGLSVKNVFGDVGDMIDPFITAAIEKQEGLRDVSDDELKMLAALGSIPVAGAVASKVTKKLNKLVPNPKGGFVRLNYNKVSKDMDNYPKYLMEANPNFTAKDAEEMQDLLDHSVAVKRGIIPRSKFDKKFADASENAKEAYDGLYKFQELSLIDPVNVPKNWDKMTDIEKMKYYENNYIPTALKYKYQNPNLVVDNIRRGNANAGMSADKGIVFDDILTPEGYYELRLRNPDYDPIIEKRKATAAKSQAKAEERARREAEKEARWRAEREAAARKAEEARLAKEAEQARIAKEAEEAEAKRIAEEQAETERIAREEAERKAQEEEFERQFREEEAAERNRYADSVGTALGMEAVNRDIDDWLLEKMIAEEEAAAKALPITTTQVQELSTGILPSEAAANRGIGTRPTYDHSRQFMDTELKQVPGIDRTGMSYGDDTDAFYDLYKAWRDADYKFDPKMSERAGYDINGSWALQNLRDEARNLKKRSKGTIKGTDPYYAAGIVGDENKRLWDRIEFWRKQGKTDEEIRKIMKPELDKYQGSIERFKERMPSKKHGVSFEYDGATTSSLKATPSEEARALKALGIDTPEYDQLERLGNFYRVFFPK